MLGDPAKAERKLKWKPKITFEVGYCVVTVELLYWRNGCPFLLLA